MLKIDGQKVKKITINGRSGSIWTHNGTKIFQSYVDIVDEPTKHNSNNSEVCSVNSNEYSTVLIDVSKASISSEAGSGDLTLCVVDYPYHSEIYDSVTIANTNGYSIVKEGGTVYLNLPENKSLVDILVKRVGSKIDGHACTIDLVRAYA